jgi:hyperosmotically inducible periplasmic protein
LKTLQSLKTAATAATLLLATGVSAQTMTGAPPARPDTPSSGPAKSEPLGERISDGTITAKAKAQLIGAKDVKASQVHVKTRHGVVSLTGKVASTAEKQRAQEIVEGVSGVRSVSNRLKIDKAQAGE